MKRIDFNMIGQLKTNSRMYFRCSRFASSYNQMWNLKVAGEYREEICFNYKSYLIPSSMGGLK